MDNFNQFIVKTEQGLYSQVLTEAENLDAIRNFLATLKYVNPFNKTTQAKARTTAKGYAPDNVFVLVGGYEALPIIRDMINRKGINTKTTPVGILFDRNGKITHPTKLLLRIYKGLEDSAKYSKDTPQISVYELLAGEFQRRKIQQGGKEIGAKSGGLGVDEAKAYLEIQNFVNKNLPNQLVYMTPKDVERLKAEKEKGGLGKRAVEWGAGKIAKDVQGYGDTLKPTTF